MSRTKAAAPHQEPQREPGALAHDLLEGEDGDPIVVARIIRPPVLSLHPPIDRLDTLGTVERETVRTEEKGDHPELQAAVRASVVQLKYTPARKADHRVGQVVEYSRSVATPVAIPIRVIYHPADLLHTPPRPRFKSC